MIESARTAPLTCAPSPMMLSRMIEFRTTAPEAMLTFGPTIEFTILQPGAASTGGMILESRVSPSTSTDRP